MSVSLLHSCPKGGLTLQKRQRTRTDTNANEETCKTKNFSKSGRPVLDRRDLSGRKRASLDRIEWTQEIHSFLRVHDKFLIFWSFSLLNQSILGKLAQFCQFFSCMAWRDFLFGSFPLITTCSCKEFGITIGNFHVNDKGPCYRKEEESLILFFQLSLSFILFDLKFLSELSSRTSRDWNNFPLQLFTEWEQKKSFSTFCLWYFSSSLSCSSRLIQISMDVLLSPDYSHWISFSLSEEVRGVGTHNLVTR